MVNEPVTKEKKELGAGKTTIGGGKIVRIRDRDSSKENCRIEDEDGVTTVDEDWPENGDLTEKNRTKANSNKLMISRSDGKRSVVVHSSTSAKSSSPPSNRLVDLRGLKRTVYVDDEDETGPEDGEIDDDVQQVENTSSHVEVSRVVNASIVRKWNKLNTNRILLQEKPEKKKKLCVDQLLKYIKPDKTVASTVVKLPKPPRPKTSPSQAASSTLIRKAMADAHKSLTSLKEDASKVSLSSMNLEIENRCRN
jgi:hypothetical protein